jgi:hypothetical protein
MPDVELIDRTLKALEQLMRMFAIERILYLLCTAISFLLLAAFLVNYLFSNEVALPQLTMIFGASGLIAASATRVSYFLNKSFDLISTIVTQLAQRDLHGGNDDAK